MINLGRNPALIVIDMQNGFCRAEGFMNKLGLDWTMSAEVIEPNRRLLEAARAAAIPIFFTRYSLNEDYSDGGLILDLFPGLAGSGGMVRGTWDAAVIDELAPHEGEHVIDKTRYTAFYGTDLEEKLRELGTDTLIVSGVTTECCVESTIRDAFFRDIRILIPEDATAATSQQRHEDALRVITYAFGTVTSVNELAEALARLSQAVTR